MFTWRLAAALILAAVIFPLSSCAPKLDLKQELQVIDVTTGWYDAGIVKDPEGEKNKLVPAISFRLKNVGKGTTIASVQINAVYHLVNEPAQEWGTTWVRAVGSEGLKPGAESEPLVLRGDRAYLGLQPRAQMLQNKSFVDAIVDINVKHGSDQWVKMASFPITRQLLTH